MSVLGVLRRFITLIAYLANDKDRHISVARKRKKITTSRQHSRSFALGTTFNREDIPNVIDIKGVKNGKCSRKKKLVTTCLIFVTAEGRKLIFLLIGVMRAYDEKSGAPP